MDDLISRQVAIDALDKHIDTFDAIDKNYLSGLRTAMSILKEMPSAQPGRKRGHWTQKDEYGSTEYVCSACHCREYLPNYNGEIEMWCYCPNCGARMDGESDKTD